MEGHTVSEVEVDEVLTACRARKPGFLEPLFPTIASLGANGAIVHYRAAERSDLLKHLDRKTPILIDTGEGAARVRYDGRREDVALRG